MIYGFWNHFTWDDDCPGRYYNTLNAIHDFKQFVSLWNRPLFVLIFFLPVQISKHSILVLMVAISALSAFYLYKGVRKTGTENAWLVVPLMLFQVYYFGVSRNGEVEPLAVAIICLAFYCYVSDKILWFAILGALLPFTRLELSPSLFIWVIILIQKKKFKYVAIFAALPLVWSILGGMTEEHFSFTWLYDQVMHGEKSENIYGHRTFGHYFQSYPYVIGPVIFFLFFIGLAERLLLRKIDLFVVIQFIIIFFIYVIFSWKLNIGNAAGFLRNLIPLTPLVAILSLNGFNYLTGTIGIKILQNDKIPDSKTVLVEKGKTKNFKKRKIVKTISTIKKINFPFTQKWQKIKYITYILLILTLYYFFFSWELHDHHTITILKNFTNILTLCFTLFTCMLLWYIFRKKTQKVQTYLAFLIAFSCIGFTIITEHPEKNINSERRLIEDISNLYIRSYLNKYKIFANHVWFYWSNDLNMNDTSKFSLVTKMNLANAPFSSVVMWEKHYCTRLAGDVDFEWLKNNKEFIELYFQISSDKMHVLHVFQKVQNNRDSINKSYDMFIKAIGDKASIYINRGTLLMDKYSDFEGALRDLDSAIKIDSNSAEAYFQSSSLYFRKGNYSNALENINKTLKLDTSKIDALYNKGLCLLKLNKLDEASFVFSKVILKDSTKKNAYLYRSNVYYMQSKFTLAIDDQSKLLQLDPTNSAGYYTRGLSYFKIASYQNAIYDLTQALKLNRHEAEINYYRAKAFYFIGYYKDAINDYNLLITLRPDYAHLYYERGECLFKLSDYKNACADFQHALNMGYPVSKDLISKCKAALAL